MIAAPLKQERLGAACRPEGAQAFHTVLPFGCILAGLRDQIRPQARRLGARGLAAEARDLGMIAVEQDFGRLPSAEVRGTSPLRTIEQALAVAGILERFECGGCLIAQYA